MNKNKPLYETCSICDDLGVSIYTSVSSCPMCAGKRYTETGITLAQFEMYRKRSDHYRDQADKLLRFLREWMHQFSMHDTLSDNDPVDLFNKTDAHVKSIIHDRSIRVISKDEGFGDGD